MTEVDLTVTGGKVYLDGGFRQLTLGITDGRITHLLTSDSSLSFEKVISLDGEFVLPGLVDGHVHLREPGYTEKEGIQSGTAAAAAGGITTIIEMPNTTPPVEDVNRFTEKIGLLDRKSHVDFASFGAITGSNIGTGDIAAMAEAGATAFKTFMATSFGPLLIADKGILYTAFEEVAETGRPLYIHAEDEEYLELFSSRMRSQDEDSMGTFFDSRPPITETTAVADVLDIVRETLTETVIAHVSTAEALEQIAEARLNDLPVHAEVTPYHLAFDREDITEVGTHGIGTPPVRDEANKDRLWSNLESEDVHLLGSDHAPHTRGEKERSPLDAAPGMPQLETALGALLDATARRQPSLASVVELYSEAPARLHGLYPRKGTLRPGADADFVIVDPDREWEVDPAQFESAANYSPFEGRTLTGRPVATYQRGRCIAEDMRSIGDPGDGEPLGPNGDSPSLG